MTWNIHKMISSLPENCVWALVLLQKPWVRSKVRTEADHFCLQSWGDAHHRQLYMDGADPATNLRICHQCWDPLCCMLRLQDRACNCMPGKDSWQCRSRDGCLFPDEKQLNHQATKSECNHGLKEVVEIREDWEKIIRPIALHKGGKRRLELSHFWSREVDSHSLFSCEKGLFYKLLGKKRLVKANCSCLSYLDISLPSPVRMDKMKGTAQKGK